VEHQSGNKMAMRLWYWFPVEHSHQEPFEAGFILGLLVGEGYFGGDKSQAAVVLNMHVRHERIFTWLKKRFPYAKQYGPYSRVGRAYYRFTWRGTALKYGLTPLLEALPGKRSMPIVGRDTAK
jgi:hypothetical protein